MAGTFYTTPPMPQQAPRGTYPAAPLTYTVALAGNLNSNGSAPKTATKSFTGSSTPIGTLVKNVVKGTAFAGSLTSSGAVSPTHVILAPTGSGSMTPTGAAGNHAIVAYQEGLSLPTGALTKNVVVGTAFTGSMTPTATVQTWKGQIRSFAGNQTNTGIVLKTVIKNPAGSLTGNGTESPRTAVRNVGCNFRPTGALPAMFIPSNGEWMSAPLAIPDFPISGSRIVWEANTPPHTSLSVLTSVDNGATWQTASNGAPVEHLVSGTQVANTVIVRVLMAREGPQYPSPVMSRLDVQVSVNAGVPELCPLGVFLLDDVEVNDSAGGIYLSLSGSDLSRRVARNSWDATYTVQPGTNYADAILAMLQDRYPEVVTNFSSTTLTTPQLQFGQNSSNDPWQDLQKMAASIGYEIFFDARGVCVLRPVPDPTVAESVWEFEDIDWPTLTAMVRRLSDSDTYNKVIVTGEGTGNDVPVQAIAIDDDPASPTYYLGPYGTVTFRYSSATITTVDQAQDAADALLRQVKGATESVEVDAIVAPHLEPGDIVTITRPITHVAGHFIIDQLSIPLDPGSTMHFTGRRQSLGGVSS